jgi:GMC oxidoreductase
MRGRHSTSEHQTPRLRRVWGSRGRAVIDWVNERPRPLGLYVFAEEEQVAEQILDATESGDACVNDCSGHPLIPELPFGEVGNSGMGKYHGRFGFEVSTGSPDEEHRGGSRSPPRCIDASPTPVQGDPVEHYDVIVIGSGLNRRYPDSADAGAVDFYQRVFGQPGLRVMDGAVMPANPGVNPSLMMTALAERSMAMWPNQGDPVAI